MDKTNASLGELLATLEAVENMYAEMKCLRDTAERLANNLEIPSSIRDGAKQRFADRTVIFVTRRK